MSMIDVSNLTFGYEGSPELIFDHVGFQIDSGWKLGFTGRNGRGKTTFLRILSGDLEPTTGEVVISKDQRMSVLKQDHFQYDQYTVLDTVIMGNQHLYDVMKEKDALYEKEDFSDEDGVKASELEAEFAEMGGWDAETETSQLLNGLGLDADAILYTEMKNLGDVEKVKVLLARALFGKPDILLLDEPFSALDFLTRITMQEWLLDQWEQDSKTVLFITHDVEEAIFLSGRVLVVEDTPIRKLHSFKVPAPYPRTRACLTDPKMLELRENLISLLRKEVQA